MSCDRMLLNFIGNTTIFGLSHHYDYQSSASSSVEFITFISTLLIIDSPSLIIMWLWLGFENIPQYLSIFLTSHKYKICLLNHGPHSLIGTPVTGTQSLQYIGSNHRHILSGGFSNYWISGRVIILIFQKITLVLFFTS